MGFLEIASSHRWVAAMIERSCHPRTFEAGRKGRFIKVGRRREKLIV